MHWRNPGPSPETVRESFVALIDLLFGRIALYFETQAELDQLLQTDNPTPDDVERLRRCTMRFTQRQYFFSRLAKAGWLRTLGEAGSFRNPPGRGE